jgi:hypothetical protein
MIYDHLPTPVQQWLDNREQDRMAGEQYDYWLSVQESKAKEVDLAEKSQEPEDADLERLEHEQSTAAGAWSGDRGAELERLERSEKTHGERSLDEPPERGIEDDEEELER